jgi:O-antigen/teichoic acid export membrane protein
MKNSLKNNALFNYFGQGWNALLGLAFVPFYIKYLGIESYGLIGFIVSLQYVLIVLDFGLSTTVNREIAIRSASASFAAESRNLIRTLECIYFFIGIIIVSGFYLLSETIATKWVISEDLSVQTIRLSVIIAGMTFALRLPISLYQGVFRGLENYLLLNIFIAGFGTILNVGALLSLFVIEKSILVFLCWHLISGLIETCVFAYSSRKILPVINNYHSEFSFPLIKDIWKYSIHTWVISFLAVIIKQLDKIILSKLLPLKQLGYFMTASLVIAGTYRLTSPISDAVFPRLVKLFSQNEENLLKDTFHNTAQMIAFIFVPVASILMFYSYEILLIWTRSEEVASNTSLVLRILAFSSLLNAMTFIPFSLNIASGNTLVPLWNNIVAVMILAPLYFFFIQKFGVVGGALPWLIFNILYIIFFPIITHRYILKSEYNKWLLQDTLPFIFGGILIFGAAYLGSKLISMDFIVPASIIAGCALYLVVMLILFPRIRLHFKLLMYRAT